MEGGTIGYIKFKVFAKVFSLSLLVILTVSCATTANYESILRSWTNVHVDNLISSWGPPQNSYPLSDGGQILEYVRQGAVPIGGYTYYVPQTTYHSGTASAYGNYGSYAYGRYSGTSTKYVPQQTPIYNVPLWCKTRFNINKNGIIKRWQWE